MGRASSISSVSHVRREVRESVQAQTASRPVIVATRSTLRMVETSEVIAA